MPSDLPSDQLTPLWALLTAVCAAVIAGAAAIWTSVRQSWNERELLLLLQAEQRRQGLTDRASTFLAATQDAVLSLRDLALADAPAKGSADKEFVWPKVDRVNSALFAIHVNDPDELVRAAHQLDRAMVELSKAAHERVYTVDEWRDRRTEIIGAKPQHVIQAARTQAMLLQSSPRLAVRR